MDTFRVTKAAWELCSLPVWAPAAGILGPVRNVVQLRDCSRDLHLGSPGSQSNLFHKSVGFTTVRWHRTSL